MSGDLLSRDRIDRDGEVGRRGGREAPPPPPGLQADIFGRTQECDVCTCMFLVLKRRTESVTSQVCRPG